MKKLSIAYQDIDALTPYANNPRTHSKKQIQQIVRSIEEFGFTNPLLIDDSGGLIAGHGRLVAARELGLKEVPTVSLSSMSEAQKRAYIIADNRLAETAGWDEEILALELQGLMDLDFSVELTGFEVPEIDLLLSKHDESETEVPEDIPEPESALPPVTQPGDVWIVGTHRLLCGDATDPEAYKQLLGGKKAQMVFTDPPYNVAINSHVCGNGKIQHREFLMASGEMSEAEFTGFLSLVAENLVNHSSSGSIHYICMDWRHIPELLKAVDKHYSELKNLCVWNKSNGGMGSLYRSKHELIFVFKQGNKPHINNIELGKHGRNRTNVWDYPGVNSFHTNNEDGLALHPTVKPVTMIADAILDCSKPKGLILDPFGGSGSTLIAAEKTQRTAAIMELDPLYCDVIIRRFQKHFGTEAIHQISGETFTARQNQAVQVMEEDEIQEVLT